MRHRWLSLAQLFALLAVAAGCAPSTHTQSGAPTQSEPAAGRSAPQVPKEGPQTRTDPSEPAGPEACAAAGGRCVLGSFLNCAQRGPQDCNPTRNPGGAFCCLKDAAPKAGSPAPAAGAGTPAGRGGASGAGSAGGGGRGGASGDAAADGGAAPMEQVDYSCETDADCSVKNVGNCCGYYPRCVNKQSPTPAFECPPGVGSVCGWPDIDACRCKQKTCRSMQGGNEV